MHCLISACTHALQLHVLCAVLKPHRAPPPSPPEAGFLAAGEGSAPCCSAFNSAWPSPGCTPGCSAAATAHTPFAHGVPAAAAACCPSAPLCPPGPTPLHVGVVAPCPTAAAPSAAAADASAPAAPPCAHAPVHTPCCCEWPLPCWVSASVMTSSFTHCAPGPPAPPAPSCGGAILSNSWIKNMFFLKKKTKNMF